MTDKKLKDTIVSQALEIAKLRDLLDVSEWFRKFNLENYEGAKEKLADLKTENDQLKNKLARKETVLTGLASVADTKDDDASIGLTD